MRVIHYSDKDRTREGNYIALGKELYRSSIIDF